MEPEAAVASMVSEAAVTNAIREVEAETAEATLPDGSNPEGIDPSPPLGWRTKEDLTEVRVVSMAYSPPCVKVRYHLAFNGVAFTTMSPAAFKKQSEHYKKVPAIFVGGRQINDSFIIIKHLTPVLYNGSEVDAVWDAKITFGLQLAMEAEAFEDSSNWPVLVTFAGYPSFVGFFTWFIPLKKSAANIRARRSEKDSRFGPLRSSQEYVNEFRAAVGDRPFLGGEQPGSVDVSMYATLITWEAVPLVKRLLQESDLQSGWWQRMKARMPTLGAE